MSANENARDDDWREEAACASVDAELFFPGKDDEEKSAATAAAWAVARSVCTECPVRRECLDMAMAYETGFGFASRHGMYGGLTPRQRWTLDENIRRERRGGRPGRRPEVLALAARGLDRTAISARLGLHPDSVSRYLTGRAT